MIRALALLVSLCWPVWAMAVSPYEVVWDSPSEDTSGTMPLGNGEVALNAWVDPTGDLKFYIARTDSWDDNGRLVKVGAVRIRVGRPSADRTKPFCQRLDARTGTLTAGYGQGDARVEMALWVDAHRPVVCVEVLTAKPAEAAALVELWRNAQETLPSVECSDIFRGSPEKTVVEPDTVLTGLVDRVGWYHRNVKSVGPALCAKLQGVADFPRPDPLLHRTFGALVAAEHGRRADDRTLRSPAAKRHVFEIYVHTRHPATAAQWLAETQRGLDEARRVPWASRRAAHEAWWNAFWQRSWIHIRENGQSAPGVPAEGLLPANQFPLRIGSDQRGGTRFSGTLGRVSVYAVQLPDAEVQRLAAQGPQDKGAPHAACLYSAVPAGPESLPALAKQDFAHGFTLEAWIKLRPEDLKKGARIFDKITAGGHDGFLFDTHPGNALRLIVGRQAVSRSAVLTAGEWQHVAVTAGPGGRLALFHNGRSLSAGNNATAMIVDGDDAQVVSRAYALQRFVAACAGRGQYPIKFNGTLFTVPAENQPGDADYRRWGPGYWWQNTRLPYYSMCAAGDFEMLDPLFRMYGRDLMPLCKFRTQRYLGHGGAYIPECIYFWGDMFTETYGWQPFEERTDKLQASRWHKWEWVSGLELVGLMLDYYEHTENRKFLDAVALPTAHEILVFFDQHYPTGPDGRMVMHPSQSLETWWECTNPMPEVAGLHATLERLLALGDDRTAAAERAFWRKLQKKLPELPTVQSEGGRRMLAPAQEFKRKQNVENPELYAVFPFRLWAIDKPNLDWAVEALQRRRDRGPSGWRQEDVFMAYLGLADQAREYVVKRSRTKHAASRFPVFWGPNYDWIPDQDHGSVLLKAVQSLLLQTDGRRIYVLPAWPKGWDAEFKLHAPYNTTVSGKVERGRLVRLDVEPASRRGDVRVWAGDASSTSITDSLGIRLVKIPAGQFLMGGGESAEHLVASYAAYHRKAEFFRDEYPQHRVRISKPFYLAVHEVTVGQFARFVRDSGYRTEAETDGTGGWGFHRTTGLCEGRRRAYNWRDPGFTQTDAHPVLNVTWNDAQAFCRWMSQREGGRYRLPSEAEWEYACRAGTTTRYYLGDGPECLDGQANVLDAKGRTDFPHVQEIVLPKDLQTLTRPVGSYRPNPWGLYDMHGNVWEWCSDWHGEDYYAQSPVDDPQGPPAGTQRVRRGGGWNSFPLWARAAFRNVNTPVSRCVNLGFRVARDAPAD